MSDLLNKIRNAQMLAGEEAVIASLKEKGLLPHKEDTSEPSQKFFMMFVKVRKELCAASPTETYHLEEAIRITFDRWMSNVNGQ